MKTLCLAALLAATPAAAADWDLTGDLRGGYLAAETRARDGDVTDTDSWRARLRAGAAGALGDDWAAGIRASARLDTRQRRTEFWLEGYAPSPSGLDTGQATIDTLYLDFAPAGQPWSLRAGRFQTAFALEGVAKKSLDRLDSPSFDVSWTDGLWLRHAGSGWTSHLILQHNHRRGPSNSLRPPLDFRDSGSRIGVFAALDAAAAWGPVVQRTVTLTWLPDALRPLGLGNAAQDDYLALTAKGAAAWPVGDAGRRLLVGAEAGWAPNTPRQTIMGSGNGTAGGLAWQASVNLYEVAPQHAVGLVYGHADDGWLVSPDFRPNEWMLELRWQWRPHPSWTVESRLRRRKDVDLPFSTLSPRRGTDVYLRTTFRF